MDLVNATDKMKFERGIIHNTLFIISQKTNKNNVIGYINFHPEEQGWFWFMGITISNFFSTQEEAIENLIQSFITYKMDNTSKKLGIYNDENFTKKG